MYDIFLSIDENTELEELEKIVRYNIGKANILREKIKELDKVEMLTEKRGNEIKEIQKEEAVDSEETEEEEYIYYYRNMKKEIKKATNQEEIIDAILDTLPSCENKSYSSIVNRIKLELLKEIHDLDMMLTEEDTKNDVDLIEEVNKENMDEVGINGANPLIYWVPGLSSGLETLSLNQTSTQNNDQSNSSNTTVTMDEAQRQTFNSKYTKYEGDSKKGSDVKSLVMEIIAGNMAEDREIKVTGDIKIINNQMPENIDNSKTYKVECKYDDEKYINEINITEN